jgi:HK97 family phage major capsid protein
VVQYVISGASGAFLSANPWDAYNTLENTITALKSGYRSGAVWLANRRTYGILRKIRNEFGDSLWSQSNEMAQPALLLGYPAIEAEDMPDLAADSYSVAFGNFKEAYVVVDHISVRLLRDPFTSKPYVKFYTTKRVGGDVLKSEAYKIIKFGTS